MSVIAVREMFTRRPAEIEQGRKTSQRFFQVDTDDVNDDGIYVYNNTAGTSPAIPRRGATHPTDTSLWVARVDVSPLDDPVTWEAVVSYERKPPLAVGATGTDPWDLAPRIAFGHMPLERVLDKAYRVDFRDANHGGPSPPAAISDLPVVPTRNNPIGWVGNSALQEFDPPLMTTDYLEVIHIEFAVQHSSFSPGTVSAYIDTINSDVAGTTVAGRTIEQFCGWMRVADSRKGWTENNDEYWDLTFEIVINPRRWLRMVMDRGFYEMIGVTGPDWVPFLDDDGKPVSEPVLLDGTGRKLAGNDPNGPNFVVIHDKWEVADWTVLDLPTTY